MTNQLIANEHQLDAIKKGLPLWLPIPLLEGFIWESERKGEHMKQIYSNNCFKNKRKHLGYNPYTPIDIGQYLITKEKGTHDNKRYTIITHCNTTSDIFYS